VCVLRFYWGQFIHLRVRYFVFSVFLLRCCLVICAIDCLEQLVSEMAYYVTSGTLNPTHSIEAYAKFLLLYSTKLQKEEK